MFGYLQNQIGIYNDKHLLLLNDGLGAFLFY